MSPKLKPVGFNGAYGNTSEASRLLGIASKTLERNLKAWKTKLSVKSGLQKIAA